MSDWYFKIETMAFDGVGHLYGTLINTEKVKDKSQEVVRVIRPVTAKDLRHPDFETYQEGDVTARFYLREELMEALVKQWEDVAYVGDRLFSFTDWFRDTGVTLAVL
jgi:hypothetical protein